MTDSLPVQSVSPIFPANEPERLAALHRYQILDTPAEAAFDRITTLAARLFKVPTVLISLVDESRAWFKSSIGFSAPEVPRDATICSFAVLTNEPLIVPDTRLDERFACNPFVQCEPGMRFYAGAPLVDRHGFNLGTLCLLDTVPRDPLTADRQATLVDLAAMVVSELELRVAAQQIARVDAALVEISQGVARVTGGDFFDELVKHFAKVLGTDYVYIGLVAGTDPKMMKTIATCDRGHIVENLEYRLQDTPCWEAIEQRKICCYPRNVQAQFPNAPLLKPFSVESYIAIPFFGADGNVLGLLGVMDGKPLANVQLAESLLAIFAARIATELERQQSELLLVEQTRLLEAVSTGQPLDECLSALCRSIAKLSPQTRACVLLTDALCLTFPRSITPDFPPSLSQGLKDAPINELAIGTCGTAIYCGEPVTCTDIATDQRWSQKWRDLSIAHGIRACHSVPIMGIDNLPLGSLMLCFNEARLPTDWEDRLGKFGTKIASIAIERLRSIENIEQSNARFESAMRAVRGTVFEWNLQTQIMYRSAGLFELLGIRAEDASPTNEWWMERMHPDDLERTQAEFLAVPAGIDSHSERLRQRFESEYRVRHAAGHWVYVSDRSYFQYDARGKLLKVIGFNTDITERKRAEAAIQESKAQLNFLLAAAEFGDWNLNLIDRTAQRSLRHDRIFGYEALLPQWTYEMFLDHVLPEDRAAADRQYQNAIDNHEPWDFECRIRRADNQVRWIWVSGYIYHNAQGVASRMLGLVADITERKRAEAALADRNQELDSFVHTVSHDLKAPLRAIANLSVWIEEDLAGKLPLENQQQLQRLRARVKRMESMVDNLLLYARSGREEAHLETFNLAELLAEIIDSLAPPEGFRIDIEPPLPTLTTKRVFLSQVFANLISNAIVHHSSVTGHLHIWAIEHPEYHEFIIKDDGPGIAPEHHEKVFAIFQTLPGKDNSDSTGIGLAIVKKIVETEQGTIRLESSLGRGTTFYVTWPKSHG